MGLSVAIQMDPVEGIDIKGDSSFRLGLEAQARGHQLHYYLPDSMALEDGVVTAFVMPLELRREEGNHFTKGEGARRDLSDFDVILMRQDPPFDMNYITATHLLEKIHPKTLVVNNPAEVRNAPEKLFVTGFDGVMPPTVITRDADVVRDFRDRHKEVIIKPLYGNGGAGVFRVHPEDENLNALVEMFLDISRDPFVVQAYLKDVRGGDRRVILVDGEPVGAINRVPAEGESRSNMHVGGRAEKWDLTDREAEICALIGPELKARGLIFVGIDVIGNWLTEINVTSPTGIQELERFDGTNVAEKIWEAIEAKR